MNEISGTCWLIAERAARRSAISRFARLRGLLERRSEPRADNCLLALGGARNLIAMSHPTLEILKPRQKEQLTNLLHHGATLYVRGGMHPGHRYSLAPFSDQVFEIPEDCQATACTLTAHPMMPKALEGERVEGSFTIPGAAGLRAPVETLALVRDRDGHERPFLFAVPCGSGIVLFDLVPEEVPDACDTPIITRLADPETGMADIGALLAANSAAGLNPKRPVACNLTLDDRPASFDYMTVASLRDWLLHMNSVYPGVHVDFAWTPNQNHPSRRYIETLKDFKAGFAWHGFRRHVDHRLIADFPAELASGERLVRDICQRYGVEFQRIMIFPFERATTKAMHQLKRAGFIASVEDPEARAPSDEQLPAYLRSSTPLNAVFSALMPILHRSSRRMLNYDQMLAQAALGLPIIAAAHPCDVGLRRFSDVLASQRSGSKSYFDEVLSFAAAKGLRAASLEQIANEVIGGH